MRINGFGAGPRELEVDREKKKKPTEGNDFKDSFFQNLLMGKEDKGTGNTQAISSALIQPEKGIETLKTTEYVGMAVGNIPRAVISKKVPVEGISYTDCDKVRIDILKGYTLKAKRNKAENGNAPSVYVEIKKDDGVMEAYVVDKKDIAKDSSDPVEQIAYEAFYGEA